MDALFRPDVVVATVVGAVFAVCFCVFGSKAYNGCRDKVRGRPCRRAIYCAIRCGRCRKSRRARGSHSAQLNASSYSHDTVRRVELLRMMEGQSCVQKFPRQMMAAIVKVQPDSKFEGVSLSDLKFDGISGKHFTVLMIDRANSSSSPTKWKVIWTEDVRDSLKQLTPTRWYVTDTWKRLKGTPIDAEHAEEMDVPVGATVEASDVQVATPGSVLTFAFSRCDLFPQANTSLQQEQLICYGCPASCHLELGPLTAAGAKWLQQHTDSSGRLTRPKKFRSSPIEPESEADTDDDFVEKSHNSHYQDHPEVELLEGFQRVHCVAAQPQWQGTMPRNPPPAKKGMFVTFQFQPQKLIDHIMQTKFGVPPDDMRTGYFDLDYFEYNGDIFGESWAKEKVLITQPLTMGVLNFRRHTGITVVGVAKLRAKQRNFDTTYDIVWFPGPQETVKEGDLFIIMRAPSALPYGPSQRIVREEDVRHFAKETRQPRDVCAVCLEAPPNIRIMPCSHKVLCWECCNEMQSPGQCPVCKRDIHNFVLCSQGAGE